MLSEFTPIILTQPDGMGGPAVTINYSFSGGLFDGNPWEKKEFLGFKTATVTDIEGNRSVTTFHQDYGSVNEINIFKGQIEKVESFDSANQSLTRTVNSYSYEQPSPGVYFPYIRRSDSVLLGSVGSKQTSMEFFYDTFGNVSRVNNLGDVSVDSDDTTTVTVYANNTDDYLIGLPVHILLQDSEGNTIRQSWTYYDGASDWTSAPTRGNPTKSQTWLDGGEDPVISREFDVYGNLTEQRDSLWNASGGAQGNHVRITYDGALHQYPVEVVNALNQRETFTYDPLTSQIHTETNVNGHTTRSVYDGFGRVIKVIGPGDTESFPTISFSYNFKSQPPHSIVQKRRVEHHQDGVLETDRTLDTYSFLDGLGRTRQTKSPGEEGKQIVSGRIDFNERGLPVKKFAPITVNTSSSMSPVSDTTPHATFEYDPLGRTVKVLNEDGTSSSMSFADWLESSFDANGNRKDALKNALGKIVEVREFNDGDSYSTTYRYDGAGNLLGITKSNGELVSIGYDSLGRKTHLTDPQMGHWTYEYDSNGNLVKQTDGKAQAILLNYDRLNRLKAKIYPDGKTVHYEYDLGPNAIGRLAKVTDLVGTQEYSYDEFGRVTKKTRTLDGKIYTTQSAYDLLGRDISLTYPDNSVVKKEFDGSFLKSVESAAGLPFATMTYDAVAVGQLKTITLGNGVVTNYTYRPDNQRLLNLETKNTSTHTLQNLGYTYDPAGNISKISDAVSGGSQNFTYDDLNRLTQAQGAYGSLAYQYDSIGNLLMPMDSSSSGWDGSMGAPKATASSFWGPGAEAEKVMDNNTHTRWTALASDRQAWLTVDLGRPTDFKEVVLLWEAAYAKSFRLTCSLDGLVWTTMVDPFISSGGQNRVDVGSRTARYVKMEVITPFNPNWGVSLWEFFVADGRKATASSNSFWAGSAIDGVPNSRWVSHASDPQWIAVDWGRENAFDTVRLLWEAAYGKVYEVQISSDNAHWTTIHRENSGDGNVDEINVGDHRARYMRLYGIQRGTQWGYSLWEIEAIRSNDRNAAISVKTTASSEQDRSGLAVDGSVEMGWVSNTEESQWWQADLGEARWINRMVMTWGSVWGVSYRLQVSMDGQEWKTVYHTTSGDGDEDTATFPSILARYVRWTGIQRSSPSGYELREFGVYGPVIKAWASTEGSSMPAAHAVDGNSRTRWSGQATDPQWLAVDFGETRVFDTVRLVWETAYAKNYLIEVSTDNTNWNIVASVTNGDGRVDEVAVNQQSARYLKIYGLARGTSWGYSLFEVETISHNTSNIEPLFVNYHEGIVPAGMDELTDIPTIQGVIQANKGKILKDANGNMVIARDKWISFDYDNRPRKIVTEDGTMTEFAYDHEGQRVYQKVYDPGVPTPLVSTYIGTIYEEKGPEQIKYIYAGGQRIAQISSTQGIRYFNTDHLGSVSLMTNTTGDQTQSMEYLPFGGLFKREGTASTDWQYTGQRQDDSTGLYFYNARYYDPGLGKFVSPDPIISNPYNPQNLNRYSYVENNPINYIDPTGHWKFKNFFKSFIQVAAVVAVIAIGPQASWWAYAAVGGVTAAATTALTSGSNFGDILKAGAVGFAAGAAAGVVASDFNSAIGGAASNAFGSGVGGFMGAVSGGAAGGYAAGVTAVELYGGTFAEANSLGLKGAAIGAALGGAGKLMEYAYTKTVGFSPNPMPGENLPDGRYFVNKNHQPPVGKNVFGLNQKLEGGFWKDFWKQSGPLSKFANQVPGMNAVAGIHDVWMNTVTANLVNNVSLMFPAVPMAYGAMFGVGNVSGFTSSQITMEEVKK
jgi:RHS repeat-associated protein